MATSDPFDRILGQPQVRRYLRSASEHGQIAHAYLFTGTAGSNKTLAAYALAQAILCPQGGCSDCETCRKVMRRKHPDVHFFEPEGAGGYLIDQVRAIIGDVELSPIQADAKVYIIDRADLLGVQAANAFLKTLEEPPSNVHFILLGRTKESVLPTVVSRCQVVPFRYIPVHEACGIVAQNTGCASHEAAIAIQACGGSISKAIEFARSTERAEFRKRVITVMESLRLADDLDVLEYAAELIALAKAPLDLVRAEQEDELAQSADFLAASAIRQIEQRNKRALTAKSIEMLGQITAIMRSWLRDVLMASAGCTQLAINEDVLGGIERAAQSCSSAKVARALLATVSADEAIRYNVSPETCIDVLLYELREELYDPHSPREASI